MLPPAWMVTSSVTTPDELSMFQVLPRRGNMGHQRANRQRQRCNQGWVLPHQGCRRRQRRVLLDVGERQADRRFEADPPQPAAERGPSGEEINVDLREHESGSRPRTGPWHLPAGVAEGLDAGVGAKNAGSNLPTKLVLLEETETTAPCA